MGTRGWGLSMRRRRGRFSMILLGDAAGRGEMANDDVGRFGWTNATYLYGLSLMSLHARRALGVHAPYEAYAEAKKRATEVK